MAIKTEASPSFIEVSPGIKVAAEVRVSEYLKIREGQNFFDQPPLCWYLMEDDLISPQFVPEDEVVEIRAQKAWIQALISTWNRFPIRFVASEKEGGLEVFRHDKFKEAVERYLYPVLPPELRPSGAVGIIAAAKALQRIYEYLKPYPHIHSYLKEMWSGSGKIFDVDGVILDKKRGGTYQPHTYAAYAALKIQAEQASKNARWAGMEEVRPDGSASLTLPPDEAEEASWPIFFIPAASPRE